MMMHDFDDKNHNRPSSPPTHCARLTVRPEVTDTIQIELIIFGWTGFLPLLSKYEHLTADTKLLLIH